jgi:hypothetical protein
MSIKTQDNNWEEIAIEAFHKAFDKDGNVKDLSMDEKNEAINLFYKSIAIGADKYWPYIKLADLVSEKREKAALYISAWRLENNQYSAQYLFNILIEDHPDILDNYL